MKSISTKYIGPTHTKGSRIRATDHDGNNVTVEYNCALSNDDNHKAACQALIKKLDWLSSPHSPVVFGGHVAGGGMVWVFADYQLSIVPEGRKRCDCPLCNLEGVTQ